MGASTGKGEIRKIKSQKEEKTIELVSEIAAGCSVRKKGEEEREK